MKDFDLTLTDATIKPVRLVKITRRDGAIIRIAESQSNVVVPAASPGDTFTALDYLEISAVKQVIGGDMPSVELTVEHSSGGTFDTHEVNVGFFDGAEVLIYVVNRANPTSLGLLFSGTIGPITFNQSGECRFDCRGRAAKATGVFVQTYSAMDRTDLFSTLNGLNPNDWDFTATVATIIDRFNFTVSGMSPSPPADGWFNGGVIQTAGGIAFRAANWTLASLRITAFLPCHNFLSVGESLTLWPGYDKTIATADTKFNNAINFQGEPHYLGVAAVAAQH